MNPRLLGTLGILMIGTAAVMVACSTGADDGSNAPAAPAVAPAGTAPSAPATPTADAGVPPGTGPVLETMNSGGYTYVRVNLGGKETWAAGPQVAVKVGDVVTIPPGMAMNGYHSNTLNRTFDVVWFVAAIQTAPGAAPAAADPHATAAEAHKRAAAAGGAAVAPFERIEGGQTVEEIVAKRADFAGKDIVVRGRVVKFNAGIMGTNWIHVQDGTGAAGTNDLTVTTDATVAVGDVVVVRGKVVTDKDFGAGYKYAVIVEKAAVGKQ